MSVSESSSDDRKALVNDAINEYFEQEVKVNEEYSCASCLKCILIRGSTLALLTSGFGLSPIGFMTIPLLLAFWLDLFRNRTYADFTTGVKHPTHFVLQVNHQIVRLTTVFIALFNFRSTWRIFGGETHYGYFVLFFTLWILISGLNFMGVNRGQWQVYLVSQSMTFLFDFLLLFNFALIENITLWWLMVISISWNNLIKCLLTLTKFSKSSKFLILATISYIFQTSMVILSTRPMVINFIEIIIIMPMMSFEQFYLYYDKLINDIIHQSVQRGGDGWSRGSLSEEIVIKELNIKNLPSWRQYFRYRKALQNLGHYDVKVV